MRTPHRVFAELMARRLLLTRGNTKLGAGFLSFSIPAVLSCPGRTPACEQACYANRGHFRWHVNQRRHRWCWQQTRRPDFVERMVAELQQRQARRVRIHVAGDFDHAPYVHAWRRIVRACPTVRFLAYTRSWRVPRLRAALTRLAEQRNMRMWWSCDRETGVPASMPAGIRLAWMAADDADLPPPEANLAFRVQRRTVRKRLGGALVCPPENGVTHTTCQSCGLCFEDDRGPLGVRRVSLPVLVAV